MSMTPDSTKSQKPAKPYPNFPLYAHASGRWAKKIRGKTHFFGPWRDWQAALSLYQQQRGDLEAGRTPKPMNPDALSVKQMVALFLDARKLDVKSGSLAARTWEEYKDYGERLIRVFGAGQIVQDLMPEDFLRLKKDLQKTHRSLVSLKGDVQKIKVFFNWAGPNDHGQGLYERPLRYGPGFKSPSSRSIKRQQDTKPPKLFDRKQIRRLLANASPVLRAMILLGINCGLGNTDCARLQKRHLNLKTGWLTYPRPKTGIERRCPLWPETIKAIRKARSNVKYVFLTQQHGRPWDGTDISHEFRKLAGADCPNFYGLRHTFVTIASKTHLQKAVDTIIGDKPPATHMSRAVYDHGTATDNDLQTVVNYVRDWLIPKKATPNPSFPPIVVSSGLVSQEFVGW